MNPPTPRSEEMFWRNVEKTESCWLWTGDTRKKYGRLVFDGKYIGAHRVSWQIHNGEIPVGLYVLHHCDNPPCVNPAHLWVGTAKDNSDDRVRKGRSHTPIGEANWHSKLTTAKVRTAVKLRARGWFHREIAERYGVSRRAIWQIFAGHTWQHVFQEELSKLKLSAKGES